MHKRKILTSTIGKLLLISAPAFMFVGCADDGDRGPQGTAGQDGAPGADGQAGVDGQDGTSAAVAITGFVQDGPVAGGKIFVFTAETIQAAMAAASADGVTDRAAALDAASPLTVINRNPADGQLYRFSAPAMYSGQPLFLVFDNAGATDMTFDDVPFNMESVAMVAESGTFQQVNINPFTTMIAQQVRAQLADDTTTDQIAGFITAAADNVVKANAGSVSPSFPAGGKPISGLDGDLLATASTEIGSIVRSSVKFGDLTREDVLRVLTHDAVDGAIDGNVPAGFELPANLQGLRGNEIVNAVDSGVPASSEDTTVRSPFHTAEQHMVLAEGLSAEFLTRDVAISADQFSWYPAENPTHQIWCIEVTVGFTADPTQRNPGVQRVDLATGEVETILRGMTRCDGLRTTPWGTILATEESGDGAAYEILDPLTTTEVVITDRGAAGAPATIVDAQGAATNLVAKREKLPTMAWEGLFVLSNGVVVGGDELRPGSYELSLDNVGTEVSFGGDTDGGALFKFVPTTLHDGSAITTLAQSPLVDGSTHALQVSCQSSRQQFGQGCEIGNASWIPIADPSNARELANIGGATGYYRPEDLHIDPDYSNPDNADEIRFCFANTGNPGAQNWGEVLCGTDSAPATADPDDRTVEITRFIEGDAELHAPDNLAFQPGTGILYVIEDRGRGDIWACLPDGPDQGLTSDGCVRVLSLNDPTTEPTGFEFNADGTEAWFAIQHSRSNPNFNIVDNFPTDDIVRVTGFKTPTATQDDRTALAQAASQSLYGFGAPITASNPDTVDRVADLRDETTGITIDAGADAMSTDDDVVSFTTNTFGLGEDASAYVNVAEGLTATFLTRTASEWWDMHDFYPKGDSPTHLIGCIEETRAIVDDGTDNKWKPSVQRVDLVTGEIETIVRGMTRCDGIRSTPWGTVLATEEAGDGAAYEILDPLTSTNVVVIERGLAGEAATILQGNADGIATAGVSADASAEVIKRIDLPTMAWEGFFVLESGVVVGGDELRPGSYEQFFLTSGIRADEDDSTSLLSNGDTDGGAIFKFIPATPRTASGNIASLDESPLVGGSTYAMQVSCRDSRQQSGQGCEIGNAAWIAVDEDNARVDANHKGATGYYRPEDMHIDPTWSDSNNPEAVRFCWANTGNSGARQVGEVVCGVDYAPLTATPEDRTVVVNRFVEGDDSTGMNAPDNLAFQPGTGILYVIEDDSDGDIWACLPDGADRDIKTDGCVRMLSIAIQGAEPTGFAFTPDGKTAYVSIQHASGTVLHDNTDTDDLIKIDGFDTNVDFSTFGADYESKLHTDAEALYGVKGPLAESSTVGL